MIEPTDTAFLVRRARKGDADAFRRLLDGHRGAIASTLYACGVRRVETAEDLSQEVALRAWQRLDSLRRSATFSAWIRRIAANAARDHLRRAIVRREVGLEAAAAVAAGEDIQLQAQRRSELRLMVAALGTEDDEVVELLVAQADGASVEALAGRVGISPAAFKMRMMRARKRLRRRLAELRGDRT